MPHASVLPPDFGSDGPSVVGQQGNYGQANCATTTLGSFGFTRTLTPEFASEGSTVEWSDRERPNA